MEEIDVLGIIADLREEFPYPYKPRVRQVQERLIAFGVNDAIGLASLIIGVWSYLFPRNLTPKCPHKLYFAGHACGSPLVSVIFDEVNKQLVMHCQNGHKTVQRTSRLYF